MKSAYRSVGTMKLFAIFLFCCAAVAYAGDELPTEPRRLFNNGAELAADGKLDEAAEVLRQVAVMRDRTIAAQALSLLGQISASSARKHLAEKYTETSPEQRQIIFGHLQSAEQSFAESLTLQPNDNVRQHLETLRAWRHKMTGVWEKYDREQRRNAEWQERIRQLANWEEKLTEKVRPLLEEPNSPRKFQTGYETGKEQHRLAEELERLQEIPIDDEELADQWRQLPEIQKIANEAAKLLTQHRTDEALPKQKQVLDYLRTLLKKEENPQNQQNQEQNQKEEQNEQGQQKEQNQQQQQRDDESEDDGEQETEMNQPQSTPQDGGTVQEESPEEWAERLLMQVRRKEQAAKEARNQRLLLRSQPEPVEKDW